MLFQNLTESEKLIIRKCSEKMLESLARIAKDGHPLFDEFFDVHEGAEDLKLDLALELAEQVELWENIKSEPESYLMKLTVTDILIFKLAITEFIPNHTLPKSKRSLVTLLDSIVSLKDINLN